MRAREKRTSKPVKSPYGVRRYWDMGVSPTRSHLSCKKVVLVNFYLAPRQKKDKLEKSPKHFKTKQSSNWNYNCTKKMVSDFWFDWLVFNVYFLTIFKVFYFTLNFSFHQKTCSDWVKNSWKFGIWNSWDHLVSRSFYKNFLSKNYIYPLWFYFILSFNFLTLKISLQKGQFSLE